VWFMIYAGDGRARALYCTTSLDLLAILACQLVVLSTAGSFPSHNFCLGSWIPRTLQIGVSEIIVPVHCLPHRHIRHIVKVRAYQFNL
jgi:hypothetical protein